MKPEDQRIAIAEALGWKKTPDYDGLAHGADGWIRNNGPFTRTCNLPDYLNDLNACHEMEKVLTEQKWGMYCIWLMNQGPISSHWECAHATAAQRCEAFLKTLGLWKETK